MEEEGQTVPLSNHPLLLFRFFGELEEVHVRSRFGADMLPS